MLQVFRAPGLVSITANGQTYTAEQLSTLEAGKAAEFLGAASGKTTLAGLMGQYNENRSITMQVNGRSAAIGIPFQTDYSINFQQDSDAVTKAKANFDTMATSWAHQSTYLNFTYQTSIIEGIDRIADFNANGQDASFFGASAGAGLKTLLIGNRSFSEMYLLDVYGQTDEDPVIVSLLNDDGSKKTEAQLEAMGLEVLTTILPKWNISSIRDKLSKIIADEASGKVVYHCRNKEGIEYTRAYWIQFTGEPRKVDTGALIFRGTASNPSDKALEFTDLGGSVGLPTGTLFLATIQLGAEDEDALYFYVAPNSTDAAVKVEMNGRKYSWSKVDTPVKIPTIDIDPKTALAITVTVGNTEATYNIGIKLAAS